MKIIKIFSCISLLSFLPLLSATPQKHSISHVKSGYYGLDATEEIEQMDRQCNEPQQNEEQIIIGTFANLTQGLVNIAVKPHDPLNLATNIVQMLGGIISTCIQLTKNLPDDISIEKRQQFFEELEECLRKEMRYLVLAKKAMLRKCATR